VAAPPPPSQPASSDLITLPRWTVHFQALLLGVVALTFFLFGMLVGSFSSGTHQTPDEESQLAYDCRVSGKLMKTFNGQQTPAIGGVVFVLPKDRFPKTPLTSDGVTPKDFQPLDNQTIAAIAELGGAVSRVGDDGQFDLIIDGERSYFLLGVAATDSAGPRLSQAETELLQRYFQPVQKLTAGSQTVWKTFQANEDFLDLATLVVK